MSKAVILHGSSGAGDIGISSYAAIVSPVTWSRADLEAT